MMVEIRSRTNWHKCGWRALLLCTFLVFLFPRQAQQQGFSGRGLGPGHPLYDPASVVRCQRSSASGSFSRGLPSLQLSFLPDKARKEYLSHVSAFQRWQCGGEWPPNGFLLVEARSGLGNRFLELVSGMSLALATGRLMLVDWKVRPDVMPARLGDLLEDPGWVWDAAEFALDCGLWRGRSMQTVEFWAARAMRLRAETIPCLRMISPVFTANNSWGFTGTPELPLSWQQKGSKSGTDVDVLRIKANQFWLPLLLQSPAYGPQLRELFGTVSVSRIWRLLLPLVARPSKRVHQRLVEQKDGQLSASCELGIQLRYEFYEGRRHAEAGISQVLAWFRSCAGELFGSEQAPDRFRIATDKPVLLRRYLAGSRGPFNSSEVRLFSPWSSLALDRIQARTVTRYPHENEILRVEDLVDALAEMFWLAECDHVVLTRKSTFGYVVTGLQLQRRNKLFPHQEIVPTTRHASSIATVVTGGACVKATSLAPCFQAWDVNARAWFNASDCIDKGFGLWLNT